MDIVRFLAIFFLKPVGLLTKVKSKDPRGMPPGIAETNACRPGSGVSTRLACQFRRLAQTIRTALGATRILSGTSATNHALPPSRSELRGMRPNAGKIPAVMLSIAIGLAVLTALRASEPAATPLRVGLESAQPLASVDQTGKPRGFIIEILEKIAADSGHPLTFTWLPRNTLDEAIKAGAIDIIAEATEAGGNAAGIESTITYAKLPLGLFVRGRSPTVYTSADLKKLRLCTLSNSPEFNFVAQQGWAIALGTQNVKDALLALEKGQCDAVVANLAVAAQQIHNLNLHTIEVAKLIDADLALGISMNLRSSDHELLRKLNEGIIKTHSDGTYEQVYERWFGSLQARPLRLTEFRPFLVPICTLLLILFSTLAWQRWLLAKSYQDLGASENLYHSLVENLPHIVARKDGSGHYTYANSAFGKLVGRPIDQIIGKDDNDFFTAEIADKNRQEDERVMKSQQTLEFETTFEEQGKTHYLHGKRVPLFDAKKGLPSVQILLWDVTAFRETELQLKMTQKELFESSRRAGMAEVAIGFLHNVGNALNSVTTSAALAQECILKLRTAEVLTRTANLLNEQGEHLEEFFADGARGRKIPFLLEELAKETHTGCNAVVNELKKLQDGIGIITQIVVAQESHQYYAGVFEIVSLPELVDYTLNTIGASLTKEGIVVARAFKAVPTVKMERQKVLQVLIGLIRNSIESLGESGRTDKKIDIGLEVSAENTAVRLSISDNGVGISP